MKRVVCKVENGIGRTDAIVVVEVADELGEQGVQVAISQAADQVSRLYKENARAL